MEARGNRGMGRKPQQTEDRGVRGDWELDWDWGFGEAGKRVRGQ